MKSVQVLCIKMSDDDSMISTHKKTTPPKQQLTREKKQNLKTHTKYVQRQKM